MTAKQPRKEFCLKVVRRKILVVWAPEYIFSEGMLSGLGSYPAAGPGTGRSR
jgi:hypothetical protein